MTASLWLRLGRYALAVVPAVLTLLIAILGQLPFGIPHFAQVTPAFSLMAVYYWSIYRPDLLPAAVVFGIGLVQDVLSGTPLGLFAMALVLVRGIVVSQRRVFLGKTFAVEWWGFFLIACGTVGFTWLVASLFFVAFLPPGPAVVQALMTFACYPFLMWFLSHTQQAFLRTA